MENETANREIKRISERTAQACARARKQHFLIYRDFARSARREARIKMAFGHLICRITRSLDPQAGAKIWEVGILAEQWRLVWRRALEINRLDADFARAKTFVQ